jgi:hypothetical protein
MIVYDVSVEYLKRENVFDFVIDYLKRNKIHYIIKTVVYRHFVSELDQRIYADFKSYHQLNVFVRKGNEQYPYFEFR